ncbi:asialoglycoprotein receptor 2-like [Branchiostoma floridae x Branchiostoma belcheri]
MQAAMAMWMILLLMEVSIGNVTALQIGGHEFWAGSRGNYWDAKGSCRSRGGHLADIKTWHIKNGLKETLLSNRNLVWIGLNEAEGYWHWSDGTTDYIRGNWHWNEPNDGFTIWDHQDCGAWRKNSNVWGWDDDFCRERYVPICQRVSNEGLQ